MAPLEPVRANGGVAAAGNGRVGMAPLEPVRARGGAATAAAVAKGRERAGVLDAVAEAIVGAALAGGGGSGLGGVTGDAGVPGSSPIRSRQAKIT
jgi:hypothetical protein